MFLMKEIFRKQVDGNTTSVQQFADLVGGSKYATRTKEEVINNWSPNNLKGVVISIVHDRVLVLVEDHLYQKSRPTKKFRGFVVKGNFTKLFGGIREMLSRRNYSLWQYFVIDESLLPMVMEQDPNAIGTLNSLFGRFLNEETRPKSLRVLGEVENSAMRNLLKGLDSREEWVLDGLSLSMLSQLVAENEDEVLPESADSLLEASYLQPKVYSLDERLNKYFKAVKEKENAMGTNFSNSEEVAANFEEAVEPNKEVVEEGLEIEPEESEVEEELEDHVETEVEEDVDLEVEPEKESNPEDEQAKLVREIFQPTINGVIREILESYTKVFEVGFELNKPFGVLTDEGSVSLSGSQAVLNANDRAVKKSIEVIYNQMRLKGSGDRSRAKIADAVVESFEKGERLYFPYKMLEFAYGRTQGIKSDGVNSKHSFPPKSKHTKWSDYSEKEIKPELNRLFEGIVLRLIEVKGDLTDEVEDYIIQVIRDLKNVFSTVIVISAHNPKSPDVLKIRLLDPYGTFNASENLAETVANLAYVSDGSGRAFSYPPVVDRFYHEYVYEIDRQLVNAEPLFAFKALDSMKRQGNVVNFDNMLLGISDGDKIVKTNREGIDLSENLMHLIISGSRSGKGLQTLNLMASAIASKIPIFYWDNKPDMASLMRVLGDNAFAVNGPDLVHNPADGTDIFGTFANEDAKFNPNNPEYLFSDGTFFKSHSSLGVIYSLRALLLIYSIIALRADIPEQLNNLGGERGVFVVIDEFKNFNNTFAGFITNTVLPNFANNTYHRVGVQWEKEMAIYEQEYAEWEESGEDNKSRPKKPNDISSEKPTKMQYWLTSLMMKLQETMSETARLDSAGIRNGESARSNIFVISQEIPQGLLGKKKDYLVERRVNVNRAGNWDESQAQGFLFDVMYFGGADGFFGYNSNHLGYLASQSKSSKAYGKLDASARNFGFLNNIYGERAKKIASGDLGIANSAVYYKPFLLFPDGREGGYSLKQSTGYWASAGLDPEDVIKRNKDENNPGHIDPRVDFKQYVLAMGVSEVEINETVNKAGEIATYVVQELGYPGTWEEFVFDLRPEWIFSVKDVVNHFKGVRDFSDVRARLPEFAKVYPSEFGLEPVFEEIEEESDYSAPVIEEPVSAEEVVKDSIFTEDMFDKTYESFDIMQGASVAGSASQKVEELDNEGYSGEVFNEAREEFSELSSKANQLRAGEVRFSFGELGVQELMLDITNRIIRHQGGNWGVEEILVKSQTLVFNEEIVKIGYSDYALENIPHHFKRRVRNGLLMRFFDWTKLVDFQNLRVLGFSTMEEAEFVAGYLNSGFRTKTPIEMVFWKAIPSLQTLRIGASKLERGEVISHDKDGNFKVKKVKNYSNSASKKIGSMFGGLRRSSWNYTKEVVHNNEFSVFEKFLLGTVSVSAAAVSGTVEGTSKLFGGIGRFARGLKNVLNGDINEDL